MRHAFGVGLFCATTGLGLAMIAVYSSCGSTDGGTSASQAAAQAVNPSCSPAGPNQAGGNCLTLGAPNSVLADGASINGFRATLVGGDGAPITGVQICFRFEDESVGTIIEPTDGCGLTDANGNVSGQFQSGAQNGSFDLIAESPPGFNLEARKTISFQQTVRGVPPGLPCSSASDCGAGGECSANTAVCPSGPCCLSGAGDPCNTSASCVTGLICGSNRTCAIPPTPVPQGNGRPCEGGGIGQCLSGCCCNSSSPATCQDSVSCVGTGISCVGS
jgi:hypothetical protein